MALAAVEDILGGRKVLNRHIRSRMDLIELCRLGVSKNALVRLAKYLDITLHQIAEFLPVTERTIQRYSTERHFNSVVSEHILYIAEVAARGAEVFGDREKFLKWLNFPSSALGGRPPLQLLNSKFGADLVLEELGRMEHGLFA